MKVIRNLLLFSILLVGVAAALPASAVLRSLTLDVDAAASDVDVSIGITFLASSDEQTIADVGFSGSVLSDVDLVSEPGFGTVAQSLRFVSGEIVADDTLFDQLLITIVIPIAIAIETQGMSGSFDDDTLVAGAPSAANTVPLDLTPIDLVFDTGSLMVTLTPPGDTTSVDLAEISLVFGLGQTGSVVTAGTDVTVTVPLDEVATATVDDVTVDVTLAGDLVLTGTLPPSEVPAVSPLPFAGGALVLAGLGVFATRRWRGASAQSTSIP